MASNYNLLEKVYQVHLLYQAQKTAEKGKIALLKQEAAKTFEICYEEYLAAQYIVNASQIVSDDNNELHISMAEAAYYTEQYKICRQLLEFYFQNDSQRDQYYCRGKILLGLLINYESREESGTSNISFKKKAVSELLQALEIATNATNQVRYKFIVYNLSIAFWEIVRPFLRSERAASFANEFNSIVNALEKQEDNDLEWRILLLSSASLCAEDEKNTKNATDYADKAIALLETLIQALNLEESKLQKTLTDCKNEVDLAMNAFREIQEREELMKKPKKIDPDIPFDDPYYTTPIVYPPLEGLAAEGYEKVKEMLDEAQYRRGDVDIKMKDILHLKFLRSEHLIRLHCQRIAVNPADGKRYSTLPNITSDFRTNYLLQVQCILSNVIPDKEWELTFQQLLTNLEKLPENEKRNETILDIARFAWKMYTNKPTTGAVTISVGLCQKFIDTIQNKITLPLSQRLRIKQDVVEAYLKFYQIEEKVISSTQKQPLTTNQIEGLRISQRIDVIKVVERALTMAVASVEDKYLVIEIAAMLWNLIYPLLTTNINRSKIHSTIRAMSTALESIDLTYSPVLKSFIYHELALCEALADYAGLALVEEQKAFLMDFGNTTKPTEKDSNLLDYSRPNDQYIKPFLKNLTLRVDVYGSPQDLHAQLILWLQQAKESTSKVLIKEMVSKSAVLLFEEIEREGLVPAAVKPETGVKSIEEDEAATVDWSLIVMQKGNVRFEQVDLTSLSALTANDRPDAELSKFSYFLQERLSLLYSMAVLAHSIQDVPIFQRAASLLLQLKWNPSEIYAYEFLDAQIHVCCLLADSFTSRILALKSRMDQFADEEEDEGEKGANALEFAFGMNIEDVKGGAEGEEENEELKMLSDVLTMKRLAIQFLLKAYQLALQRKDIYAIHNVIIYFWNLHLHVMKGSTNYASLVASAPSASSTALALLGNTMKEFGDLIKTIIQSIEVIVTFPYTQYCFDPKIFINLILIYSMYCEAKGQLAEALEIAIKGSTLLSYPNLANGTIEACFLKRQLVERASQLTILNSINGVVAAGAKGGKASASLEPLPVSDNAFLAVFSNLAVAELQVVDQSGNSKIPKEILLNALDKAWKGLQNDVTTMITKEDEKVAIKVKEVFEHRLEMMLECYARISRLKIILESDYVVAQDIAEKGVILFQQFSGNKKARGEDDFEDDEDGDEEWKRGGGGSLTTGSTGNEFSNSRIYRYVAICEQNIALAVISFFQNASSATGAAALDPALIGRLQYIALQHFHPSLVYAIKAIENDLIVTSLELILLILRELIHSTEYSAKTFLIGNLVIDVMIYSYFNQRKLLRKQYYSHLQKVVKDIFLVLINHLIREHSYDRGLKLIQKAFDVVTDQQLQKDLWPGKVVCMSKKGMNVLDGLQKLKESNNPLLQAEVLALFARSTNDIKNKITTYQQVVDILSGGNSSAPTSNTVSAVTVGTAASSAEPVTVVTYIERIDYLIELGEVMNAYGFPRQEIKAVLKETLIILNEYEEMEFEEIKDWEEGDDEELRPETSSVSISKRLPPKSTTSSQGGGVGKSGSVSRMGAGSKTASKLAGSQKGGRSRAPSRSNRGGTVKESEEEELRNRNRMRLKQYEQSFRLSMMMYAMEFKAAEKRKYLFKAVYYIHRSLQHIFITLQDCFKKNAYQEATKDGANIEYETFLPNYPDFLVSPFTCINDPIQLLKIIDESSLRSLIKQEQTNRRHDLPSFDSFPSFSATIYQLFAVIEELKENNFYDFALLAGAYTKLILLTTPLASGKNDRLPALLAVQLLAYQTQYYQGKTSDSIQQAMGDSSIIMVTPDGGEVKLSLGQVIIQYVEEQRMFYSQKGIVPTHFLDMSFTDMLQSASSKHSKEEENDENNEEMSLKMNPFQLDTSNLQFTSLTSLEVVYYWMRVIPLLLKLGQFTVAEQLIYLILFQCRELKAWKWFLETSAYYLQILSLQGKQTDILAFAYSERLLLQKIGDVKLFHLTLTNLFSVFISLQNYDEMKILFQLIFQLLSDLSIRKIIKQKPTNGEHTQSSLFPGASLNALPSKIGTQSALDLTKPASSHSIRPTSSGGNKNEYSIMEIGNEYLQCLYHSLIFYLSFLRQYYSSRISIALNPSLALLNPNAEKWEVEDAFQEFFQCHQTIQDIFVQYLGETHEYVKEINYQRACNAFEYLKNVHLHYSKNVATSDGLAAYNDWLIERVKRCAESVKGAIDIQKLEVERYEPLFNLTPPPPPTLPSAAAAQPFNDGAVSLDFSAPPTSAPLHPLGNTTTGKLQPAFFVKLGEMQLEYAKMLFYLASLHRQHLPVFSSAVNSDSGVDAEADIIAKYLKETEANQCISSKEAFYNNYIAQVTSLSATAMINLTGDARQLHAKLLTLISHVANVLYQRNLSVSSAALYREQLHSLVKEQIDRADTDDEALMELFATAIQALIESYQKDGNVNKSAYWIFYGQSLTGKISLKKVWKRSLMNSTAQQQNELMNCFRRISFFQSLRYPNPTEFKSYQADINLLKAISLPAIKRLSIATDPFDVLTNIEPFYAQSLFLTVNLCPLKRFVYVSVGRRGANSAADANKANANKGKDAVPTTTEEPKFFFVDKMELSEDHRRLLQTILLQHQQWQLEMNKFMAMHCDTYFDNDDLLPPAITATPTPAPANPDSPQLPNIESVNSAKAIHQKAERALSERFSALVNDLAAVFSPLLGKSSKVYQYLIDYIAANKPPAPTTNSKEVIVPTWNLTLLMDASLQILPWEAVPLFEELFPVGRVARDFSVHFAGHRVATLLGSNAAAPNAATAAVVNSATIKFLIDPFNEDTGSKSASGGAGPTKERKNVQEIWKNLQQTTPGGNKWSKLRSQNGLISLEDFILTFDGGNKPPSGNNWMNFITYCLGRFGSYLNPKEISILNLEKIQFFCNLDYNYNDLSYRRQNSLDVIRKIQEVELENAYPLITLLSLAGVNSMIMNTWSIPFIAQNRFLQSFCKGFMNNKEKMNQALSNIEKYGGGKQKSFIAYARVVYGIPSLSYSE